MSIYLGDTKISGNAKELAFPLFTSVWQDHIVNNASWLRSETFSWQSGAVYVSAYNHLADDVTGITSETETVAGTTITFYRATDGHKIVLPDQESNVEAIYAATGVAWYYVLDTANQRFKLPRSKYAFVGLRGDVGNYVSESLPNITGYFESDMNGTGWLGLNAGGCFSGSSQPNNGAKTTSISQMSGDRYRTLNFNASNSSSAYQNGAPVQQRATQMYLYFYVGNTIQGETSVNVAELAEDLNGKADIDLGNLSNDGKIVSAHLSMPSGTYDLLTLGTSGSTYTAPADGYFMLYAEFGSGTGVFFDAFLASCGAIGFRHYFSSSSAAGRGFVPAKKGDVLSLYYSGTLANTDFKFVYAEGSKSLA